MAVLERSTPAQEAGLVLLTVEQYHRMAAAGILEEGAPIELLDGLLVRKIRGEGTTVNPRHAFVVNLLSKDLMQALEDRKCHYRAPGPVTLPPHDEPEPDGAIARGTIEDYPDHHPGADDVSCVIEVADSSLQRDRTTKQRIYSSSGIPQYLILNLVDRQAEVHEDPDPQAERYRMRRVLAPDDEIPFLLPDGQRLPLPAGRFLP
jgi:Uma2 family endonuclease